jgi:TrmH family RNA methyltransferase
MDQTRITSIQNTRIKSAAKLRKRRERDRQDLMLIEGLRELTRALEAGIDVREVFICPPHVSSEDEKRAIAALGLGGARRFEVNSKVYAKLAYREASSCLVAVAQKRTHELESLPTAGNPFYLVVDAVEKPGNLGAMLRSADAAGAAGIIVSDPGTDIYNPNVIRASLGTIFTVPVAVADAESAIRWLRDRNIRIFAATPEGSVPYTDVDLSFPCAIVVGREDLGLGGRWLEAANEGILIPMKGRADSLNVSAAAAVLLYEALRQRT